MHCRNNSFQIIWVIIGQNKLNKFKSSTFKEENEIKWNNNRFQTPDESCFTDKCYVTVIFKLSKDGILIFKVCSAQWPQNKVYDNFVKSAVLYIYII